jgi:N-acetylmuramoyl-L-alanine amidase
MLAHAKALWSTAIRATPKWLAAAPAVAVVALAVWSGQGRATGAGVIRVRMGGDQAATRVVIELERSAHGELVSDQGLSDRVVLALPGVEAPDDLHGSGQGLVKAWSVDEAAGAARLELELSKKAQVRRRFLLPPADGVKVYRYVIDLQAQGAPEPPLNGRLDVGQDLNRPHKAAATALATRQPPAPAPAQRPGKRVVVIDAGHDLTLAAARALKTRLERTGRYKVVLTRTQDVFVPLNSRVAIARRAGADLFISLHANSAQDATVRGASVYTLSDRGVDRAERKALRHDDWLRDPSAAPKDPTVNRILLDLTQRDTTNRSSAFARLALDRLQGETPLLQSGHRDANFAVLLAPDVPCVLIEMGFITNPDDEAELADHERRGALMNAVAEAVDDYFGQGRSGGYAQVAALP